MPHAGIKAPVEWDEFIAFVADEIEPLMDRADKIGFCFSYTAEVTPEIDGRVVRIDQGSHRARLRGAACRRIAYKGAGAPRYTRQECGHPERYRGRASRRSAVLDKTAYSGFFGQVSGTGTNTCCAVPYAAIKKLHREESGEILVNLESGLFSGMPRGKFDMMLDEMSKDPGHKFFEKMTAGVYLGELTRLMLVQAAEDKLLSAAMRG